MIKWNCMGFLLKRHNPYDQMELHVSTSTKPMRATMAGS